MNAIDIIYALHTFFGVMSAIAVFIYFLMPLYTVVGFFATKKFPKAKAQHKYAVLIAARDEEAVIGNLIKSIKKQDYPQELITVFVVADNCNDKTALIARECGAVCYERKDDKHRTKGYALEFLTSKIDEDYGILSFDGYFIFDADNLLNTDYISCMNDAFDNGEKIITSYRNTKNFADNWISASYALHWIRTIRHEHRGRSALGLATRIQGTGFLFASEIIKDGWHYVSFTEDRAFAADAVVSGYRISYCDKAEFYDEQPTSLRIAFRQRIRWAKGHLQAFVESGPKLFKHIFFSPKTRPVYNIPEANNLTISDDTTKDLYNDSKKFFISLFTVGNSILTALLKLCAIPFAALGLLVSYIIKIISQLIDLIGIKLKSSESFRRFLSGKFFSGIKSRIMSFDMLTVTFPNNLITIVGRIVELVLGICLVAKAGEFIFGISNPLISMLIAFLISYTGNILIAIYVFIIERKRIPKIPLYKKCFFCIMWPCFDLIGEITVLIALFSRVEWKVIPHSVSVDIDDIRKKS